MIFDVFGHLNGSQLKQLVLDDRFVGLLCKLSVPGRLVRRYEPNPCLHNIDQLDAVKTLCDYCRLISRMRQRHFVIKSARRSRMDKDRPKAVSDQNAKNLLPPLFYFGGVGFWPRRVIVSLDGLG
jgi:hypothetical protein